MVLDECINDLWAPLLTGVIVLFFTQLLLIFFFRPLERLRRLKNKIKSDLEYCGNKISESGQTIYTKESQDILRRDSTDLSYAIDEILFYKRLRKKESKELFQASKELMGLSNSLVKFPHEDLGKFYDRIQDYRKRIKKLLKDKNGN